MKIGDLKLERKRSIKKIIFVVGPTAVGKTEVAVSLAKKIKGEIISCDSMQVYKEVRIASNKPSEADLREVPHHLLDVVSVEEEFDVAAFRRMALEAMAGILKRNKIPLIVGGSGLYLQVLLDGIFTGPSRDEKLRKELEAQAKSDGREALYAQLKKVDPKSAEKIHPHDLRRIIRALEVALTTHSLISTLQEERDGLWGKYDIQIFALNRPRERLYELINTRVDVMFKEGIVLEIQELLAKPWSHTAESIIGVKEIRSFLNGEIDLERTKYLMKLKTRHFAKRQLTWFRAEERLKWIMINEDQPLSEVTQLIEKEIAIDRD